MPRTSPNRLASSLYQAAFASRPATGASAPGRVNLLGEHTDYNGGPVLPFAIPRRTAVFVGPAEGWAAASTLEPGASAFEPAAAPVGRWTDYLAGVVRVLVELRAAPAGARIAVASSVPVGAGLSSSAALTVAAARALSALAGRRLSREAVAEVAYRAEHDVVGVQCGRMDQMVAVPATARHACLIETSDGGVTQIPFERSVLAVETGVRHRLTDGEYNRRRAECTAALEACRTAGMAVEHLAQVPGDALPGLEGAMDTISFRRLRHVVTETARTRAAAMALSARDYERVGRFLSEGHASLRDDFESSCGEADRIVASALRHGAWGARLTGAGWGGTVLVMGSSDELGRIGGAIATDYRREVGRRPVTWLTRASGGARREQGR